MRNMYAWVPWFRQLAARIAEGGKEGLIERVKSVVWEEKSPALLEFGDKYIDPLSFLNHLASVDLAMTSVSSVFDVDAEIPQDDDWALIFPTVFHLKAPLGEQETYDPDLLWALFRQAVPDKAKIDANTFDSVLNLPQVGVFNLTSALCLTNAHSFLPLGKKAIALGKKVQTLSGLGKCKKKTFTLSTYEAIMRQARKAFPGCRMYEIGRFLYEHGSWDTGLVSKESSSFHISTKLKGDKGPDFWNEFERDNSVWTAGKASAIAWDVPLPSGKKPYPVTEPEAGDIMLVRCGTGQGRGIGVVLHNDYAKEGGLRPSSRIHVVWINKSRTVLAKPSPRFAMDRAASADRGALPGFGKSDDYRSSFDLFRDLDVPVPNGHPLPRRKQHLNQILYGPPGTGKTWNTVACAVSMIEGREVAAEDRGEVKKRFEEYRRVGQVEMVTFHQNYAYEDFVEGIRPTVEDASAEGVGYVLRPGVFREMVERAAQNLRTSQTVEKDAWTSQEVVQGFLEWIRSETASGGAKRLAKGAGGRDILVSGVYESRDGDIAGVQLGGTTNQKLFRRVLDRDYRAFHDGGITEYTEIGRTRPGSSTWHGQAVYFFELLKMVRKYHKDVWRRPERKAIERRNFVLILDEINRGNIARIFGELITLVEESRRIGRGDETKVTLPNSGDEFGVPENLYLIGTMNTADRSIALLDTALRRRFEFVEMMPDSSLLDREVAEVHLGSLLDAMNERIRFLRDREHQIGHTYFLEVCDLEGLRRVFQNRILPLLQEYFYDDWAKIEAVLGKNGFVESVEPPPGLAGGDLVDAGAKSYELLSFDDGKWGEPASYRKIYEKPAGGGAKDE